MVHRRTRRRISDAPYGIGREVFAEFEEDGEVGPEFEP